MIRPLIIATVIAATPFTVPMAASAQTSSTPHAGMHQMHDRDAPLIGFSITEEMKTPPDRASIGAGVTTHATSAVDAMRQNTVRMNALIDAIKRAGIAERDIQTSGFNLSPQYDYTPQQQGGQPRLTGYQVSNQLRVTTADTARVGALIDALVAAGGTNIDGPSFFVADPDAMLDTARETAMRRATARAERYARAAGYASARLVSVNEGGGFQPMPQPMVMARMASAEDAGNVIQPGQVSNGITLNVQFRLER
ncbi:MAG: SIMPL domain-containing protein [Sphingopyxis sp.]